MKCEGKLFVTFVVWIISQQYSCVYNVKELPIEIIISCLYVIKKYIVTYLIDFDS
jgi:hypothetical protein